MLFLQIQINLYKKEQLQVESDYMPMTLQVTYLKVLIQIKLPILLLEEMLEEY